MSQKSIVALVGLALVVAGCSKEPVAEITASQTSMEAAVAAGAETYAPESYAAVQQKMSELNAELEAQEGKMGLMRKYGRATELAAEVQAAAQKAAADAEAGKQAMMAQATALMTEARTALDATMSLLASAPAGKGGSADLEMMRQDLERASASLTEAEASFAGGNYQDAVVKAQGVMESVQTVHAAVQAALDAKTGTNPRG